jgi:hypothetical protein
MSERAYRLIQGLYLLAALVLESDIMVYILLGLYVFEILTNLRIPLIVSRVAYGSGGISTEPMCANPRIDIDAERLQRLAMGGFIFVTYSLLPEFAWFGPWFAAAVLIMAGATNVCPIVFFLRSNGFK